MNGNNKILKGLSNALQPLKIASVDKYYREYLLSKIGVFTDTNIDSPISTIASHIDSIIPDINNLFSILENGINSFEDINSTLESIESIFEALKSFDSILNQSNLSSSVKNEFADFGIELVEYLFVRHIKENSPYIYSFLLILKIITPTKFIIPEDRKFNGSGDLLRTAFIKEKLELWRIKDFIKDPVTYLITSYLIPTSGPIQDEIQATEISDELFPILGNFLSIFNSISDYGISDSAATQYSGVELLRKLRTLKTEFFISDVNFGFEMYLSHLNDGNNGVVVTPFGSFNYSDWLNDDWFLDLHASGNIPKFSIGPNGVIINSSNPNSEVRIDFLLRNMNFAQGERLIIGGEVSHLEIGNVDFIGKFHLKSQEYIIDVSTSFKNTKFVLSGGDGFLSKLFGEKDLEIDFDFNLGFNNVKGLYFKGSASMEVAYPNALKLGNFSIDNIKLRIGYKNALDAIITGDISFRQGSLSIKVQEIGLISSIKIGEDGKVFSDAKMDFKPPTGLGISVDSSSIKGGGFLKIDTPNKRYTGALQLKFGKLTFTAIGILRTELPGGKDGYSLLLIITAEGFKPIQLGYGFQLEGVGGLLGLNRTADVDVLRAGVRTGNNEKILFPKNVIANADAIISALDTSFPEKEGRFIFGPMAKIGWGSGGEKIINIDLGILIEVPKPVKLAILGVVKAIFPPAEGESEENAKLVIKISFLGVLDFGKKQISFDASIYDSRIASFTLSGDMAFRLYYGENANFLMSVGGFHPSYTPPPMDLPTLRRLTVSLIDKPDVKVSFETYFAVTSNTVQIGAKLTAYATAGPFNFLGVFWLDALFQFKPFYFIVNVGGMVAIKNGNKEILTAGLELTLQGPSPWKIDGIVYFTVLKIKKSIRISKEFGKIVAEQIEDVNVLPELTAAIDNPDNWLIINTRAKDLVTTRKANKNDIFLHPIGSVRMSQSAVPLELYIQKFANAKPKDYNRFYFSNFQIGSESMSESKLSESFAPAMFKSLSNEQKLSAPSFEKYKSGFELGTDIIAADYLTKREIKYDPVLIDRAVKLNDIGVNPLFQGESDSMFNMMRNLNTAADASADNAAYQKPYDAPNKAAIKDKEYTIRNRDDQAMHSNEVFTSYVEAQSYLASLINSDEDLQGTIAVMANNDI